MTRQPSRTMAVAISHLAFTGAWMSMPATFQRRPSATMEAAIMKRVRVARMLWRATTMPRRPLTTVVVNMSMRVVFAEDLAQCMNAGAQTWIQGLASCAGEVLDQCGVCGGDDSTCVGCTYETACNYDPNAVILDVSLCEFGTCPGCTDPTALNYNPTVTEDDGSCQYVEGCTNPDALNFESSATMDDGSCILSTCDLPASVTIERKTPVAAEGWSYRFYLNLPNSADKIDAVFGNNESPLLISAPEGIYNWEYTTQTWNASHLHPAFVVVFPELVDDSYATIGLETAASESGIVGSADPSLVQDPNLNPTISQFFTTGGTSLNVNTLTGASWYVLNTAANALPDENGRILIAQITTGGALSGVLNISYFPMGVGADQQILT